MDDATFFLSELLRELILVIPPLPGVKFKDINRRLGDGEMNKNAIFSTIRSLTSRLKKPVLVFVDDMEKIKSDPIRHLTRSERTLSYLKS